MDRRRFLESGLKGAGFGLLFGGFTGFVRDAFSQSDALPDIALARGPAKEATQRAIDAIGGMRRFVEPGHVVVLKPNASFEAPPEWGATTHPDVVSAVLDACFEAEARRVYVVDHTLKAAEKCFARTGLGDAVAAFTKAKLVSLDDRKAYREVIVPSGKVLKKVEIPVLMEKVDLFINLPSAKSHSATGVSLGLKNLMGLIWDRHHFHDNIDIHQGVADLATILKPQLTILDAIRILKTGGPAGPGDVDPFNGVIAGVDPVAVDAYGVGLSTWNRQTFRPNQIRYIRASAEQGLGTTDLESLRIKELT